MRERKRQDGSRRAHQVRTLGPIRRSAPLRTTAVEPLAPHQAARHRRRAAPGTLRHRNEGRCRILERAWTSVGIGDGYKDPSEFGEVLGYLTAGDAGARAITRMGQRFDRLPGLSGLDIYARAGILAPS